jgi:hypothetical protein
MNKPLAVETEQLFPLGPSWENMDGGALDQEFEEKFKILFYQDTVFFSYVKRRIWKWSSLSIGALLRGS